MSRRPPGALRSMNALRGSGVACRARALIVLVAFAIGSIFARDAVLLHQIYAMQAELDTPSDEPEVRPGEVRVKLRPSGISRRTAMNPTDPPDDDDELDEDSDTLGGSHLALAVSPAIAGSMSAGFISADLPPCVQRATARPPFKTSVSPRGPPTIAFTG